MSPEQWADPIHVGPRSDLYSLAVIAYEALTGHRPFVATTVAGFAELHCNSAVPALGEKFSTELDQFFARALAKQPEDRFGTALDLAAGLRTASRLGATSATPPGIVAPKRSRRLAIGIAASLVIAGGVVAFMLVDRAGATTEPSPAPPSQLASKPDPAPNQLAPDASAPPVATTVPVHIESSPSRADVYRLPSQVKVGVTTWDSELEVADGLAVFVVRKRGYIDGRVEIDLHKGGRTRITLVRIGTRVPPTETHRKGEPMDPFKDDHP
jgi:serine/threonine protein kinase